MTEIKNLFFYIIFLLASQFVQAQNAPDFTFTDVNGITHNLQDRLDDGYIIMLDFFYVDCPPCVETGIGIESISNDYQGQNVEIWSISPFDSNDYIQEFQTAHNFNYIAGGIDGGGYEIIEMYGDSLNLEFFPSISVICPNGDLTWDIWPYTSDGAPEWREPIENCGVYEINITAATEGVNTQFPSSIYPNPAQDLINIEFYTESADDVWIDIYDITGRQLLQKSIFINNAGQQNEQFSINKLTAGNYVVRITQSGNSVAVLPFQK